jgi:4-amino-4-deoxy-L-arabinose transferase-like glycosyltransferase
MNKNLDYQKLLYSVNRHWAWVVILIIILSASLIRIHLLEVPFERDEGEYAYAGQLILQGIPPYEQVYNMKMPGIYAVYALILAVFGQTHYDVHLGLLLTNALTIIVLFLLGRKLFGRIAGTVTAASFALFSLGQPVQGIFANAEHFVAGSMLLGLGFVIKQHGGAFIAFAGLYVFFTEILRRPLDRKFLITRCLLFLTGVLTPFIVTCLILWQAGVFEKFWFWTFVYAREYVSSVPFSAGLYSLKKNITRIISSSVPLWLIAGIGLTALFWDRQIRRKGLFTAGFFLFSFLAICPGFYFRPHYFILFLPSAALLAGAGGASLCNIFSRDRFNIAIRAIPVFIVITALLYSTWQQRNFLFNMNPAMVSRTTYGLWYHEQRTGLIPSLNHLRLPVTSVTGQP